MLGKVSGAECRFRPRLPTLCGLPKVRLLAHCSAWLAVCAAFWAFAGHAFAHPLVEAGVEQVNDAAFEDALSSFDAAWNGSGLTRDDLVTLLANRAVANFALRANAAVDRDLGFLAALDRNYVFAPHVPPPMRDQLEEVRKQTGQPSISVLTRFAPGKALIVVEVPEMPGELIREVRVFGRPIGGAFSASAGGMLEVPNPEEHAIEWYAEVVGPGGAVLLREGEAAAPRRALHAPELTDSPAPSASPMAAKVERPARAWRWWAIGGGTAAVAVAATVAVLVAREPAQSTQVSPPVLR